MSRTMPSVTNALTPWFFAMPTRMSPTTLASSYASVAITMTSPGHATGWRRRREVVACPAPHRERDAAEALCAGERPRAVERAAPAVRVHHPSGWRGRDCRRTRLSGGRAKLRRTVNAGGFVAMSDPFSGLRGRRGARPGGRRRAVRARPPWRQRCAARAPSRPKRRLRASREPASQRRAARPRALRRGAARRRRSGCLGANAEDDVLGGRLAVREPCLPHVQRVGIEARRNQIGRRAAEKEATKVSAGLR